MARILTLDDSKLSFKCEHTEALEISGENYINCEVEILDQYRLVQATANITITNDLIRTFPEVVTAVNVEPIKPFTGEMLQKLSEFSTSLEKLLIGKKVIFGTKGRFTQELILDM